MRFMLLQNYAPIEGVEPMSRWTPEEIEAHIDFQIRLNAELTERGELIDAQGPAGPDLAKFVTRDGEGVPVVTDGPFPEFKELLAGYRIVDVESPDMATSPTPRTQFGRRGSRPPRLGFPNARPSIRPAG